MSERGRPFEPGNQLGRGRPKGSPNKKSLLLQELLLNHGEEIVSKVIERAKKGDRAALALCMERLIPRLKDVVEQPVERSQGGPHLIQIEFVDGATGEVVKSPFAQPGAPQPATPGREDSGSCERAEGGQQLAQVPMEREDGPGTFGSRENVGKPAQAVRPRNPVLNNSKNGWS